MRALRKAYAVFVWGFLPACCAHYFHTLCVREAPHPAHHVRALCHLCREEAIKWAQAALAAPHVRPADQAAHKDAAHVLHAFGVAT